MSVHARSIAAFALCSMFIAGCSGPQPQPQPSQSSTCVGEQCDGSEPTALGCDRDPGPESIESLDVNIGETKGTLAIRKANPAVCDRIYWGWFDPKDSTTGGWEVTFKREGKGAPAQKSEPGNPLITAWTTVLYVKQDVPMQACVTDVASGQSKCTSDVARP